MAILPIMITSCNQLSKATEQEQIENGREHVLVREVGEREERAQFARFGCTRHASHF